MDIQSDRPEFVVMGLAHLQLRHPIKNFAWIEVTKNPALKIQQKRRVDRIAKVEQGIRSRQSIEQFAPRHSDWTNSIQLVHVIGRLLIKQTITSLETVLAKPSLEILNALFIFLGLRGRGQELEPNGIETKPAQSQHPLERDGKVTASFRIFRCKAAPKKDCHRQRIARGCFRSSAGVHHLTAHTSSAN